jgi:hypothetical protein
MALLPARRGGSLTRPGSQAEGRWDPFAEFEDLYTQMGRLMDSAFGGMWQPLAQAWAPLADLSETDDAYVGQRRPGGQHLVELRAGAAGRGAPLCGAGAGWSGLLT